MTSSGGMNLSEVWRDYSVAIIAVGGVAGVCAITLLIHGARGRGRVSPIALDLPQRPMSSLSHTQIRVSPTRNTAGEQEFVIDVMND
jgi:hypothetical protein